MGRRGAVVNLTSTFVPGTPAFALGFALASSNSSERACRDTGQTTGAPEELEWDIFGAIQTVPNLVPSSAR